jgi:hypothetical protein
MTNKYSAYPQPVPGGYRCMIRVCRDSRPNPVMAPGDKPKVLDDEGAAWKEIALHLLAFMNGREIRGEKFDAPAKSIKEAKFEAADRKLFLGGGRVVQVQTIGERA